MTLRRLAFSVVLFGVLAPGAALAQPAPVSDADRGAARQLVLDGVAALERKDYAAALDRFTRADALYRAPTVTLGLARANAGLGKLVAAQELYNKLAREALAPDASEAFKNAVVSARTELAALEPRVPSLVIDVRGGAGPRVTVDNVEVPAAVLGVRRPVDPGQHVVRAVASRFLPGEATVNVAEGKTETVTLTLTPAPPGTPDAVLPGLAPMPGAGADAGGSGGSVLKPVGFAVLGVGAVGLLVGGITMGMAASKHSDLIRQCPGGHCPPSLQPTLGPENDSYRTLGGVAVGGLVGGGVLAAAGIAMVVTAPKSTARAAVVSPIVGPAFVGAGVGGRF
jgi:hypothetical protein